MTRISPQAHACVPKFFREEQRDGLFLAVEKQKWKVVFIPTIHILGLHNIALLLLRHLKQNAKFPWHMSNLVSLIRLAMFSTIKLEQWLDNPLCLTQDGPENVAIDTS